MPLGNFVIYSLLVSALLRINASSTLIITSLGNFMFSEKELVVSAKSAGFATATVTTDSSTIGATCFGLFTFVVFWVVVVIFSWLLNFNKSSRTQPFCLLKSQLACVQPFFLSITVPFVSLPIWNKRLLLVEGPDLTFIALPFA